MHDFLKREDLFELLDRHGSPLNIIHTEAMIANIAQLQRAADRHGVDYRIFFARKSNKCLSLVDQALSQGIGIDTASENEVLQCLAAGCDGADMICTAAIKSEALIRICIQNQICIAADNRDELSVIVAVARQIGRRAEIAIRLGGFLHQGVRLATRFGFDATADMGLIDSLDRDVLSVRGVHFHLDGYDAMQRVSAITQSLDWVHRLGRAGHAVEFLDMGGGIPMSYLDDPQQWSRFWREHDRGLLGDRPPITYRNHPLGKHVHDGRVIGQAATYPYHQSPVRGEWLTRVLQGDAGGESVASRIGRAGLQLRSEPGRSLLDGCGMTIARVEYCKPAPDGDRLIGLAMNRTQCRTTSVDYLVDPIWIPHRGDRSDQAMTGYLVGAYCTEAELITLRRLCFRGGVCRGDLIAFPNTAGYLMHFMESRSHQFPLAKNLVVDRGGGLSLDPIDRPSGRDAGAGWDDRLLTVRDGWA